ncbi:MAG TPA: RNA pyrophosphohydrolase [Paracoccaceae bacterium]|nr:RNA pyrophosphohydrolase [Paracoccaceae bacterium]
MTEEEILKLPYRPCVGVMLVNSAGRVFVGQRIDSPGPAWQMPQGGIDAGEEPAQAAIRELWEETGVSADDVEVVAQTDIWLPYDLPYDLVPKLWKGQYRGQEQLWFLMRLKASDDAINIATEHPEFSQWKWMDPSELIDNIVPFKRSLYARVLELLGPKI